MKKQEKRNQIRKKKIVPGAMLVDIELLGDGAAAGSPAVAAFVRI